MEIKNRQQQEEEIKKNIQGFLAINGATHSKVKVSRITTNKDIETYSKEEEIC